MGKAVIKAADAAGLELVPVSFFQYNYLPIMDMKL